MITNKYKDIKLVIELKVRCNKQVRNYINDYITQQEKVGELLKEKNRQIKLLKSRLTYDIFDPSNDDVIENNSQALEECGIKIAQLEKELGL